MKSQRPSSRTWMTRSRRLVEIMHKLPDGLEPGAFSWFWWSLVFISRERWWGRSPQFFFFKNIFKPQTKTNNLREPDFFCFFCGLLPHHLSLEIDTNDHQNQENAHDCNPSSSFCVVSTSWRLRVIQVFELGRWDFNNLSCNYIICSLRWFFLSLACMYLHPPHNYFVTNVSVITTTKHIK